MKNAILATLCACVLFLTGCGIFSGLNAATEAFNETQANVAKAQDDLQKLAAEITALKAEYDAAVKSGDSTRVAAATAGFRGLLEKYEAAKNVYESGKVAFDAASKRVADSKGTENYLWSILGIVAGGLGGVVGGFGKWGTLASSLASGVKKIADNNVDFIDPAKLSEFKATLRADMTPKEIAAIDKARGKRSQCGGPPTWCCRRTRRTSR